MFQECRTELMRERKLGMKARLEAELGAAAGNTGEIENIRSKFNVEERDIEHAVDHTQHTFATTLSVSYNFLSS
ncbi:MAG: hypothetical protein CMJ93_02700 [Planctomycetes bacterium]|nr:hypothetical protein [Planctomycetota bacterium]